MIQFRLYRKQFFRHRGFELRHAAFAAAVLVSVCTGIFFTRDGGTAGADDISAAAEFLPLQPNIIEQHQTGVPDIADAGFHGKPRAAVPASSAEESIVESIQTNIASMLEAGVRLTTSEKKVVVGKGDTLMNLLIKKAFVPREDAYLAVQALSKVYNPKDIRTGREITVFFHKDPSVADSKFSGVRIEKDMLNAVTVKRDNKGGYTVKQVEKGVSQTLKTARGTIDSSLYADAKNAGVPDSVILDLIKMYSWNVDFQREIHSGDKFEVMYQEYKTDDGKTVSGKGNIIYAKLVLGGQKMPFYRFEDKSGFVDYYDDNGRSAKKPLMRTPIDGARLSSGFGMRKHPVLGYSKMHKGLDFAAPRGTPIYAAGDGVVDKMGPFSGYGNFIRIRHNSGLATAYGHMSRFKQGLHGGSRVKQGDVIGYVGTTGRSTGPHLHYEVIVNNVTTNPASVKLPMGNNLKGRELKSFQRVLAQARTKFNNIDRTTAVADNSALRNKSEKIARN